MLFPDLVVSQVEIVLPAQSGPSQNQLQIFDVTVGSSLQTSILHGKKDDSSVFFQCHRHSGLFYCAHWTKGWLAGQYAQLCVQVGFEIEMVLKTTLLERWRGNTWGFAGL